MYESQLIGCEIMLIVKEKDSARRRRKNISRSRMGWFTMGRGYDGNTAPSFGCAYTT